MTTVFLAGGEIEKLSLTLFECGVKNILYSYYYLYLWNKSAFVARMIRENPGVRFFLDSGAFTLATSAKEKPEKFPSLEDYKKRYFQYIDLYGEHYCRIAELDFDAAEMMTLDEVDEVLDEMLERWPTLNVCPIMHPWRGIERWKSYIEDPRIKVLGIGMGRWNVGELRRMVMMAHMAGKPVHGFGMTKVNTILKYVPLDSADSSSWLSGQKFGTQYIFNGRSFITLTQKNRAKQRRKQYKKYFESIGCDYHKILEDDVQEVRKSNAIAWIRLAARLEYMRKLQNRNLTEAAGAEVDNGAYNVDTMGDMFRNPPSHRDEAPTTRTIERSEPIVRSQKERFQPPSGNTRLRNDPSAGERALGREGSPAPAGIPRVRSPRPQVQRPVRSTPKGE